jgi:hypothetical protein
MEACHFCTRPATNWCACGVAYCNQSCQKNDWKTHQHICKPIAFGGGGGFHGGGGGFHGGGFHGGGGGFHGGGGHQGHFQHDNNVYGRNMSARGWNRPGGGFFTTAFLLGFLGTWMFFEYVEAERINFEIRAQSEAEMRQEIAQLQSRPDNQRFMQENPGVKLIPDAKNNRYVFARETSAPE